MIPLTELLLLQSAVNNACLLVATELDSPLPSAAGRYSISHGGQGVLRPSIVRVGCVLIYENTIVWRYDTSTGLFSEDHIMNLHSLK